jgi:hypothetical protein
LASNWAWPSVAQALAWGRLQPSTTLDGQ